jgi:exosortase
MALLDRTHLDGLPPGVALALTILASVTFVISAFVLCFGKMAFRAALFPLVFLASMVPLPPFILNRIIVLLQIGSTEIACRIFQLVQIPVSRQGFTLFLPNLTIEVARECSSIRSSTAMVIAAVLAGHWFLRSPRTKLALVIAALPIAVVKNAIRIFTLSVLEMYVFPGIFGSSLHHRGGIIFFLMGLAVLVLVLYWLRYLEDRTLSI